MNPEHYRRLEKMYLGAPINRFYKPAIEIGDGCATIAVEVREDMLHAAHALHGSVYFKVLDDAAFFAANSLIPGHFVLTAGFSLHLLRPVTGGTITATGRIVHRSRRLLVADAVAVDDQGNEVARGTGSFMVSDIELTPEVGYGVDG
jgi:uncharacterized protein (TIGR00369 family)